MTLSIALRPHVLTMLLATWIAIVVGCQPGSDSDIAKDSDAANNGSSPGTDLLEPIQLQVSKETTFFLGPLRDDGTVDYIAAYNAHVRKGVTPQNNAFNVILQACGPSVLPEAKRDAVQRAVGMAPLPAKGEYYVSLSDYTESVLSPEDMKEQFHEIEIPGRDEPLRIPYREGIDDAWNNLYTATERPWRTETFPHVAVWLRKNEKPLEVFKQAAKRTRLYLPLVTLPGEPDFAAAGAAHEVWGNATIREMARALLARAMNRLHYNQPVAAWNDILAVHRLAELVAQTPNTIEMLVAASLRAMACDATIIFVTHEHVNQAQVNRCAADCQSLKPFPTIYEAIHISERTHALSGAMFLWEKMKTNPDLGPRADLFRRYVDINVVLKQLNNAFDQNANYSKEPRRAVRMRTEFTYWDDWEERRDASQFDLDNPAQWFKFPDNATPQQMRDQLTKIMADGIEFTMVPLLGAAGRTLDQVETRRRLLFVSLALEQYRRAQGQYPESLSKLIPAYLKFVPVDPFSPDEQMVRYRKTTDGYRVYSVGFNGKDEDGRHNPRTDDEIDDDSAIIVPVSVED